MTGTLPPGSEIAGYRIERLLGVGGMGVVYAAHHPRLPRLVALKLLHTSFSSDPLFRSRFEREADLAGRLDHPNIVSIHDRGSQGDQLWITMQYIDGHDAAAMASDGPLPVEDALHIVRETAKALDHAHSAGLLHRDVKPANILLRARTSPPHVLLTDFGIAKAGDEVSSLTETGTLMATLHYAAPEQLNSAPLGPSTDQYALACTLFRLLGGRPPYNAPTPGAVITGHLIHPVPRISELRSGLPRAVDAVFERALHKDANLRYPTCTAMVDAAAATLQATPHRPAGTHLGPAVAPSSAGAGAPPTTRPASPPTAGPRTGRRRTPWLIGAAAAVVAVIAATAATLALTSSTGTGTGIPATSAVAGPATTPPSNSAETTPAVADTAVADTAVANTVPDAWAAGRATISMFPDLLPADPDGFGYRNLQCAFATRNPDSSWEYAFTCSDPEGIDLQVLTHDGPSSVAAYVATLPEGNEIALTSRYGTPMTVRRYNGSTGPWLSVQFASAPQSAVLLQVFWKGLPHQEIIDQWLLTAPL